ncbi:MAG: UvrB/UvrC motif-containing protein [Puniceicoccales bacterium]|jgi:protein arginine kinase activator|nr:UvrB/UvrC motif-containing protein [Puniceicoccales bacterium]
MKKCQICGKPATVNFTQIIDDEMKNIDLCDECAAKHGLFEQNGSPLSVLAALGEAMFGSIQKDMAARGLICSSCGCTPTIFKETGRLGCKNCYKDLNPLIEKIVESSQKGMRHIGKQLHSHSESECTCGTTKSPPTHSGACECNSPECKLDKLKLELERAITEERYEDAAVLRDEIKNV